MKEREPWRRENSLLSLVSKVLSLSLVYLDEFLQLCESWGTIAACRIPTRFSREPFSIAAIVATSCNIEESRRSTKFRVDEGVQEAESGLTFAQSVVVQQSYDTCKSWTSCWSSSDCVWSTSSFNQVVWRLSRDVWITSSAFIVQSVVQISNALDVSLLSALHKV